MKPSSLIRSGLGMILTVGLTTAISSAQDQPNSNLKRMSDKRQINGIIVGAPKFYDERSLRERLDRLRSQLDPAYFPDTKNLFNSINSLQGATASSSSLSGGLKLTPSSISDERTVTRTNNTDSQGEIKNDSGTSVIDKDVTKRNTPEIPSLPTPVPLATPGSVGLTFGLSPYDQLSRQIELAYQISNLNLLLERSISDRSLLDIQGPIDPRDNSHPFLPHMALKTRRQAIFGFSISVDNTNAEGKPYKDAVAEVEIEVKNDRNAIIPTASIDNADKTNPRSEIQYPPSSPHADLSLVALYPERNTYNVATYTQDTKSFSLGAAVQIIAASVNTERKNSTTYLLQDNDTIALEMDAGKSRTPIDAPLRFGWQFRPVLGRRSVDPGVRQVFAATALPVRNEDFWRGTFLVTTRWRRYDRKTRTVGELIPGSDSGPVELPGLNVPRLAVVDAWGSPAISVFDWRDVGDGNVLVNVEGLNFTPGTYVQAGKNSLDARDSNFKIQKETRLSFIAPARDLAAALPPAIVNAYRSTEISYESLASRYRNDNDFSLQVYGDRPYIIPLDEESAKVTLWVQRGDGTAMDSRQTTYGGMGNQYDLYRNTEALNKLVVTLGDTLYGMTNAPITQVEGSTPAISLLTQNFEALSSPVFDPIERNSKNWTEISFIAPLRALRSNNNLRVSNFLWGKQSHIDVSYDLYDGNAFLATSALNTMAAETATIYVNGRGFDARKSPRVFVGSQEIKGAGLTINPNLLVLTVDRKKSKGVDTVVVMQDGSPPVPVKLSKPVTEPEKPKESPKEPVILAGSTQAGDLVVRVPGVVAIVIPGLDFSAVKKVSVSNPNSKELDPKEEVKFTLSQDNRELKAFVPKEIISTLRVQGKPLLLSLDYGGEQPQQLSLTLTGANE